LTSTETRPPRPASTLPHIDAAAIPEELRADKGRFVAWAYEWKRERRKWTKVPKDPRTGRNALANKPSTWGSIEAAMACAGFDGIGYELGLGDGPYFGIDLDGCADGEGRFVPEAQRIVAMFAGCYIEWSPSRTGVHIIGKGRGPWKDPKTGRRGPGRGFTQIEVYDRRRYLTLTGWPLECSSATIGDAQAALDALLSDYFPNETKRGTPPREDEPTSGEGERPEPAWCANHLDDDAPVSRMFAAKNGDKARRLWNGEIDGYGSQSEADQALLCIIAFWTRDAAQIERVFARSELARRGKWSERSDYRERSVAAALAFTEGKSRFDGSKGKARRAPPDQDGEPSAAAWPRVDGQHGLAVEVRQARSTRGGKWTFRGRLLVDDRDAGPVEGGCSSSGRETLAKAIVELARDVDLRLEDEAREDVRRLVRRVLDPDVLADLRIEIDRREAESPNHLLPPATVAAGYLKDALALAFRDPNGDLWSETEERALRVHDLQVLGGEGLRDALLTRADSFQHVDDKDAYALLRATETCARAAYGNLRSLPTETQAGLGPESAAAKRHRGEVLFAIDSHEQRVGIHRDSGSYGEWRSSTLTGAVRALHDEARRQLPDGDEAKPWLREWRRVHGGYALAARFRLEDDGLVHIDLAVRAEILRQTRTPNPNRPPDAWVQLGHAYECIERDECRVEGARWQKLTARMLAALDLKPLPPIDERRRNRRGPETGNTKGTDAGARQTKPPAATTEGARRCSACNAEIATDRWGGLCLNCHENRKARGVRDAT